MYTREHAKTRFNLPLKGHLFDLFARRNSSCRFMQIKTIAVMQYQLPTGATAPTVTSAPTTSAPLQNPVPGLTQVPGGLVYHPIHHIPMLSTPAGKHIAKETRQGEVKRGTGV